MKSKTNRRILVVEDEPVIGNVCSKVLSRKGYAVDVVTDGKMAIDNINDCRYDLCILDMRMPGIDGIQFYNYLSDNLPELSRNVVFTSGDISSNQVSGFLRGTEKVYLEKPFTPQELVTAVELALN